MQSIFAGKHVHTELLISKSTHCLSTIYSTPSIVRITGTMFPLHWRQHQSSFDRKIKMDGVASSRICAIEERERWI